MKFKRTVLLLLLSSLLSPERSYSMDESGASTVYSGYGDGQTVTGVSVGGGGGATGDYGTCTITAVCLNGTPYSITVSEMQDKCYQECADMREYSLCPGTQIPSSCGVNFRSFNQPAESCPSGYSLAYCTDAGTDTPLAGHKFVSGGTRFAGNSSMQSSIDCGCAPNGKPTSSPSPGINPSASPSSSPGINPSASPSSSPGINPSASPSPSPGVNPSPSVSDTSGLKLILTPNLFDFGSVNVNSDSAIQDFTLLDDSPSDGRNCRVTFSLPDFQVVGGSIYGGSSYQDLSSGAFNIIASKKGKIQIKAKPTAAGLRSATLSVVCAGENSPSGLVANGSTSATIMVTGVTVPPAAKSANCPPNYELLTINGQSECRPKLPLAKGRLKSDFTRNKDGYPVCGSGRVPVTANEAPLNVSTFDVPNSSQTISYGNKGFLYAKNENENPVYLYENGMSCACASPDLTKSQPVANGSTELSNKLPVSPYSKISSQMSTNQVDYSPVAFSKLSSVDGRAGSDFQKCGCPNLNEEMVKADTSLASTVPQGVVCKSRLKSKLQVLVEYDPELHSGQVYDLAKEPVDGSGKLMTEVALPVGLNSSAILPYKRRIWACPSGYILDLPTGSCTIDWAKNQCAAGDVGMLASAVSGSVVVASGDTKTLDDLFNKSVNKKLSCCLNDFTRGQKNFKFDCVDNSKQTGSFDDLWKSVDDQKFGGQLNAIMLSYGSGKPVSGFYTLSGSRCSEFSEFGGEIKLGRVDPKDLSKAEEKGSIPLPSGSAYGFIRGRLARGVPSSPAERARCPILVRAAIQAECGENAPLPAVQRTVDVNGEKHCSSAKNVAIHVRVEQVTELVGKPVLSIQDSVLNSSAAGNISVRGMIDSANGGDCPSSTTRVGNQCIAK